MSKLCDRLSRWQPKVLDGLIALAMLIEIESEVWLDTVVPSAYRLPAAIAAVLLVAPVVARRRWPAPAFVACAAVLGLLQGPPPIDVLNSITGTVLPLLLLAFTAGARLELRRGLGALALGCALIVAGAIWATFSAEPTGYSLGSELIGSIVLPAAFWGFGRMSRERARRATAFRDLVARVERDREQHEHTAAAEERLRIGAELQDIIAQNVSAIIIQAGGARQLINSERDQARDAILSVERSGREALADLRRTLGLLRTLGHDPRELAPQPGLSQLEALLNSVRMRGLVCKLHVEGERPHIAAGMDLLAYRVIEATLLAAAANGPNHMDVIVGFSHSRLEIKVLGRLPVAGPDEHLHAISARVALYDGTLQIDPLAEDGFALNAHLPLAVPVR